MISIKAPSSIIKLAAICLFSGALAVQAQTVAYLYENDPWGNTETNQALDIVYGSGTYDVLKYSEVGSFASTLAGYNTLVMQGSDESGEAFLDFIAPNKSALENWVSAGGKLFMYFGANGIANSSYDLGFGLTAVYPAYSQYGSVVDLTLRNSPNSAASVYSAGYFGHSVITTSGLSDSFVTLITGYNDDLLTDYVGDVMVAGAVGSGYVVVGGITLPEFWSAEDGSSATGMDLLLNVINYAGTAGGTQPLNPVPEPSTYAVIVGALALGFAVVRRRKKA